jgi:hypothetical protein
MILEINHEESKYFKKKFYNLNDKKITFARILTGYCGIY